MTTSRSAVGKLWWK